MRKLFKTIIAVMIICSALMINIPLAYGYNSDEINSENTDKSVLDKYTVVIRDDANLLTNNEKYLLQIKMNKIAKYGNVAFVTTNKYNSSTVDIAESTYRELFKKSSGTLFMIDMYNRKIWIFSDGSIYKTITKNYANVITDNTYKYASKGNYYLCAEKSFDQIYRLLEGRHISQPMKYISNALLAVIIALLVNYFIARRLSVVREPANRELVEGMNYSFDVFNAEKSIMYQTQKFSPRSKGSSGHGGSGGGHSGGHSGGGGGHSF